MKKILLIILCSVSLGYSQTVRYVSANTGDDTDPGTSWALAWLTLGEPVTRGQVEGDTVVAVGSFPEAISPNVDGSSGNSIVWIDSVRFEDGFSLTVPDTNYSVTTTGANEWSLNFDDFHVIIGFEHSATAGFGLNWTGGDCKILQCRFNGDNSNAIINLEAGQRDSVISCVFLPSASGRRFLRTSADDNRDAYFVNNTIYGDVFNSQTLNLDVATFTRANGWTYKNNIIHHTANDNDAVRLAAAADTVIFKDWNNNIYYFPAVTGNEFDFAGSNISTLSVWADSVNNYDPDGESNSLDTDPALQNVGTTAHILNTSVAAEAGSDLGFGNDIGYFQTAPATGGTPATKKKVRPRWWN